MTTAVGNPYQGEQVSVVGDAVCLWIGAEKHSNSCFYVAGLQTLGKRKRGGVQGSKRLRLQRRPILSKPEMICQQHFFERFFTLYASNVWFER